MRTRLQRPLLQLTAIATPHPQRSDQPAGVKGAAAAAAEGLVVLKAHPGLI